MTLAKIIVEVYCNDLTNDECRYRLFCNNDLITERKWRWASSTFIEEEIWVNLPSGNNTIKLEPINFANSKADFYFKNFSIDSIPYTVISNGTYSIEFLI